MSEYQYYGFRAIDHPVSDENLKFMRKQSTRANVTPWSFDNEYHFGDFRGDSDEMLRRGYDIHIHYADFGIRSLYFRLPAGLPPGAEPYLVKHAFAFVPDKQKPGGILRITPYIESGELEESYDGAARLASFVPLRAEIMTGDLRPFYIAHLAVACDAEHDPDELPEPPIPAGLDRLTAAQRSLADWYGIDEALLREAAKSGPPPASAAKSHSPVDWLRSVPPAMKDAWLARLLSEPHAPVRDEMLAAFRKVHPEPTWPTAAGSRTIGELTEIVNSAARERQEKERALEQARLQAALEKRLRSVALDAPVILKETEKLVAERTAKAYSIAATKLAELSRALAGTDRAKLAEQHALKLRQANPRLYRLAEELKMHGLLPE